MVNKFVTLMNGTKMPLVGLGTLQSPPDQLKAAIKSAIDIGYRLFDTAWVYGNEAVIGETFAEIFAEGKVKREDIFVTTKLHTQFLNREDVVPSLKDSLSKLRFNYVDLYIIHSPVAFAKDPKTPFPISPEGKVMTEIVDLNEAWKGMEECYDLGLAKAIGLSNFNSKQIQRIWDKAVVKPMNLQVECNIYHRQQKLHNFLKNKGITMTAYGPLGAPTRMDNKLVPDNMKGQAEKPVSLLDDDIVANIAKNHNVTNSQVCLKYLVQRQISVIPKSVTPARLQTNFDVWGFTLTDDEMKTLDEHPICQKAYVIDNMSDHPEYPFNEEF